MVCLLLIMLKVASLMKKQKVASLMNKQGEMFWAHIVAKYLSQRTGEGARVKCLKAMAGVLADPSQGLGVHDTNVAKKAL